MDDRFRRGVRLSVDVGQARIGVARCDADSILCTPVETIYRDKNRVHEEMLDDLIDEFAPMEIVVGLPLNMDGTQGRSAHAARSYAKHIVQRHPELPVRLVDERLSTVSAQQALTQAGRSTRQHKAVIDQAAAVVILEHALDTERRTGEPAGELVVIENGNNS